MLMWLCHRGQYASTKLDIIVDRSFLLVLCGLNWLFGSWFVWSTCLPLSLNHLFVGYSLLLFFFNLNWVLG
jgi:hypothetical protein